MPGELLFLLLIKCCFYYDILIHSMLLIMLQPLVAATLLPSIYGKMLLCVGPVVLPVAEIEMLLHANYIKSHVYCWP